MTPLRWPLLALLVAVPAMADEPTTFLDEWRAWQSQRVSTLKRPHGWLSLVGLHWLKPGPNRVPGLPGTFELKDGQVSLRAAPADGWRLGRDPVTQRRLAPDTADLPDRLILGSRAVMVIERGGKLGLRVWDSESPVRKGFDGIEAFPPDPRWRLEARWEPYPHPKAVEQPSVIGIPETELAPGRAHFTLGGQEYTLEPTLDGDQLFFVFKDRTAPAETYGGGRFLTAPPPRDGKVILDFNRAYNPPCVFTPHATCPLPLPENVLPVRIEAGEKRWHGH